MEGTILVADDDRTIRTVLAQALTRAGCRVRATGTATTLWRWIEEGEGDVVVTDVMMPDGDALDLLPAIRKKRAGPAGDRDERAEHGDDRDPRRGGRGLRVPAEALRPEGGAGAGLEGAEPEVPPRPGGRRRSRRARTTCR